MVEVEVEDTGIPARARRPERGATWRAGAAALLLVAIAASEADAAGARLRWDPIGDIEAVGYRIYVRLAGRPYDQGLDVGAPETAPDGTMTGVVQDLEPGVTYYFAVAAYDAAGKEGEFSRELPLGPTEPCIIDRCRSRMDCEFGIHPDGVPCQGAQPCGVCAAATCSGQVAHELTSRQVRMKAKQRGGVLTAAGRFALGAGLDPAATGVAIEISDPSGGMLYRGTVPGSALRWNRARTMVRLVRKLLPSDAAPGLQRLQLRRSGRGVTALLRVSAPELLVVRTLGRLSWALNFGADQCVADGDLVCGGSWARTVCR
jgi:hypothetical protein